MTLIKYAAGLMLGLSLTLAAQAEEVNGVMMVVKGDIKVTSAKDQKTEPGKVGKKVLPGDTITAGADSRAKIVMSDKNVINVSPDSKIAIEKYENDGKNKNVELNVMYGKVRASVEQKYDGEKSKFNIRTPSAVAGVRGTDFMTGYDRGTKASQIITFTGTVAVGKPGPGGTILNPVFVQPGQVTNVGDGKKPEPPKSMPKEELNKMNNESKADSAQNKQGGDKTQAQGEKKDADKKDGDKKDADKPDGDKKVDNKKQSGDRSPASEVGSGGPAGGSSMVDSRDLGPDSAPTLKGPVDGGPNNGGGPPGPPQTIPPLPPSPMMRPPSFIDPTNRGPAKVQINIIRNK